MIQLHKRGLTNDSSLYVGYEPLFKQALNAYTTLLVYDNVSPSYCSLERGLLLDTWISSPEAYLVHMKNARSSIFH